VLTPRATGSVIASSIAQGAGLALIGASLAYGSKEPNAAAKPPAFVFPGVARGFGLTAGFTSW
jgi:hypothetical protein